MVQYLVDICVKPSYLHICTCSNLENYAKWQLLWSQLQFLDDQCVEAYYRLKRDTNPRAQIPTDRNEMCIGVLETFMPVGLSRVYAQFVLPEGSAVSAISSTDDIKAWRKVLYVAACTIFSVIYTSSFRSLRSLQLLRVWLRSLRSLHIVRQLSVHNWSG